MFEKGKDPEAPDSSRTFGSTLAPTELSHVYIEFPPLRFNIKGASGVMYDEGTRQLLVSGQNKIYAWSVLDRSSKSSPRVNFISEGPVLAVKFSLDQRILAIQRTLHEIELVARGSGAWRIQCRKGSERILGFFWTATPGCDLVLVTPLGLELYSIRLPNGSVRLVEFKRLPVTWYSYTHESRLVILASGQKCLTLVGFQFAMTGIMKVPKFEVPLGRVGRLPAPILAPEDLHIAVMYGRLYCIVVDRITLQLRLYRLYSDAVIPQVSIAIYSPHVATSVVDNVLLVHQTDAGVVLVFDPLTNSPHPIASPLPLTIRKQSSSQISSDSKQPSSSSSLSSDIDSGEEALPEESTSEQSTIVPKEWTQEVVGKKEEMEAVNDAIEYPGIEEQVYGEGWIYAPPDIILDHSHGSLWILKLDLEAIAASCSDLSTLLAFLQRRRLNADKAKMLSIQTLRSIITEKSSIPSIASAFDLILTTYSDSIRLPGNQRKGQNAPFQMPGASFPVAGAASGIGALAFAAMASSPGMQMAGLVAAMDSSEARQAREREKERERECMLGGGGAMDSSEVRQAREKDRERECMLGGEGEQTRGGTFSSVEDRQAREIGLREGGDSSSEDRQAKGASDGEPARLRHGNELKEGGDPGKERSDGESDAGDSSEGKEAGGGDAVRNGSRERPGMGKEEEGGNDSELSFDNLIRNGGKKNAKPVMTPTISPEEVVKEILQMGEDDFLDARYLTAVIIELLQSLEGAGFQAPVSLHVLLVKLLLLQNRQFELHQMLQRKVIEASLEVADILLKESGSHSFLKQAGLEIFRQRKHHFEYVNALLSEGFLLQALQYARKNQIGNFDWEPYLDTAVALGNPQKLAAVIRFCSDFMIGFSGSPRYSYYVAILQRQLSQ